RDVLHARPARRPGVGAQRPERRLMDARPPGRPAPLHRRGPARVRMSLLLVDEHGSLRTRGGTGGPASAAAGLAAQAEAPGGASASPAVPGSVWCEEDAGV